eukprot:scaffold271762_cov31-Tisochrysis_lutea.AAC.2
MVRPARADERLSVQRVPATREPHEGRDGWSVRPAAARRARQKAPVRVRRASATRPRRRPLVAIAPRRQNRGQLRSPPLARALRRPEPAGEEGVPSACGVPVSRPHAQWRSYKQAHAAGLTGCSQAACSLRGARTGNRAGGAQREAKTPLASVRHRVSPVYRARPACQSLSPSRYVCRSHPAWVPPPPPPPQRGAPPAPAATPSARGPSRAPFRVRSARLPVPPAQCAESGGVRACPQTGAQRET